MSLHRGVGIPTALESDEPHYRQVFDGVLAALQGVSDRVEAAELGTAYVGLDGLNEMYGGSARLARALLNAVPPDLQPRVGLARGKFPAHMAATKSKPNRAVRVPANVREFLAPHPIHLLPVSPKLREDMHRLGLHRMGDVASLARDVIADRFGPEGRRAWELCNGIDRSPLIPLAFDEAVVERTSLPFHTSSMEALLVALDTLLKRAYARPDMEGRCAGAAEIVCNAPRLGPMGEKYQVQAPRRFVAAGLFRPEKPVGAGPSGPTRGRDVPHPVGFLP